MLLGGCTTLSSGIAVAPPGVDRNSFQECLLTAGFYSPHALTGVALDDWTAHHALERDGKILYPAKPLPSRDEILRQTPAKFIVTATAIIADGMMPSVEYVDPNTKPGEKTYEQDYGANLPYAIMRGPDPYPAPDRTATSRPGNPGTGMEPGPDWRLNRFLDCYVAPVGPASAVAAKQITAGDADTEGRLLRGHILLALLAQYGTELIVSRPSSKQVTQAELLLGHVIDAERSLRGASLVLNPETRAKLPASLISQANETGLLVYDEGVLVETEAGKPKKGPDGKTIPAKGVKMLTLTDPAGTIQPTLGWYGFTTRLLRVFQVGVDVERIDAQQTLDRASNLIAAFSGAIQGFLPILKDGLSGFVTVQKTRIYGDAYLRDARATLNVARNATLARPDAAAMTYDVPKIQKSWALWDNEIDSACKVLATVAKKDEASGKCIPDPNLPEKKAS
ncbi:hypothetical protein EWE75_17005 [Sphingomonas populi]|uniref:Uncharacterized protein n=1 Tax=Sphingomonas populi TaxID=2484750 RepID=A0A4Q6Y2E5_9SPHN|nr:hypothetical protein [Sphingomonas populi]RZF63246.1 hypothetical protein EWE75_17005 [Sphingomonas populi]